MSEQKQRYEVATFGSWNADLDHVLVDVEEKINEWLSDAGNVRILSTSSNMSPPYRDVFDGQVFAYTVIITFEYVEETPVQRGMINE